MVRIEKRGDVWKVLVAGRASPKNFYTYKSAVGYWKKKVKEVDAPERSKKRASSNPWDITF